MKIDITKRHDVNIIRLEGDFISEVDQEKLRIKVRALVEGGDDRLVLNLKKVKHINSCGLGSLVCILTTLRKANGDLRLTGTGKYVKQLLQITHLDGVIPTSTSEEKALRELRT